MDSVALTDVGQKRDANEDTVTTASIGDAELLIVADGMGGHSAGDVASNCAIEEISTHIETALEDGENDHEETLRQSIKTANEAIYERIKADSSLSGMGTTAVVALCSDDQATIGNVGDSRAYHIDTEITQITVDHSLVQQLVEAGDITEEEAENHPQRNVISRYLGTDEDVDVDTYTVEAGGTILLCSDGLTEEVPDDTIFEIVEATDGLEPTAEALIQEANANGGSDNISVSLYTS